MIGFDRQCARATSPWLTAAALSAALVGAAFADDGAKNPGAAGANGPPVAAENPAAGNSLPPQPPPPVIYRPGFLHQLGRWWDDSVSGFGDRMKNARDKIEDFNKKQNDAAKDAASATEDVMKNAAQAAKDAASAVVHLPGTRAVEFHERCSVAPNGAPDCQAAAAEGCRKKGFGTGQPIDVSTSRECPAATVLSGQPMTAPECHDVTMVLRAICQ